MGGGCFQFFTKNWPQKQQKRAILHTSQANGGARAPPPASPWLRYCRYTFSGNTVLHFIITHVLSSKFTRRTSSVKVFYLQPKIIILAERLSFCSKQ